ncbi:hypothetical protein [Microvirga sp. KLBC 81]|uniref:hypothetical protein n=1 Tax=Microvirga sp. KLBC 81 TaxID=1862707 RepID=UPI001FDF7BDD|nr:hypothetical protein [Microvirga sp. KLBC 81]
MQHPLGRELNAALQPAGFERQRRCSPELVRHSLRQKLGPEAAAPRRRCNDRHAGLRPLDPQALRAIPILQSVVRAQPLRWRRVTSWLKGRTGPGISAQWIAERINAMSGGRLQIDLFAVGETVSPFAVLAAPRQRVS